MERLQVTAAAVVLPTVDGREQYLYKGAIIESAGFTEKGIKHARAQGLLGEAPEVVEEEQPEPTFSQADVDAAVKAATDAQADELKQAKADLDAAKAELEKKPASKPAAQKS
jgi:multidrug efflux pump subunit AcrA (membrane-fusion protein)